MEEPLHCQIIQGAKFRVRDRESHRRLGVLNITKLENNLLWYVQWDDNIVTEPLNFPWNKYCELYETDTRSYCLCKQCISSIE